GQKGYARGSPSGPCSREDKRPQTSSSQERKRKDKTRRDIEWQRKRLLVRRNSYCGGKGEGEGIVGLQGIRSDLLGLSELGEEGFTVAFPRGRKGLLAHSTTTVKTVINLDIVDRTTGDSTDDSLIRVVEMALPTPQFPLRDHCSVTYNNTLFVYSPEGFQSLPLREGAQWSRLPMDVSVRGARCVKASPRGDESQAALYIVGGATNGSSPDYAGLQRYRFADRTWMPIKPSVSVTQNRRNHGAVYLSSSSSILIYAGSQDTAEPQPSSQTFLVSLEEPFTVTSYSSKAPPLVRPQLLRWTNREAIMVGGDPTSRRVYTFSKESGWGDAEFELDRPLPDDNKAQAVIMDGDDGSKTLVSFDLSVSPNRVDRTVLRNSTRVDPPPPSSSSSSSSSSSRSSPTSTSTSSSSSPSSSSATQRVTARSDDGGKSRPPAKRRKRATGEVGSVPAPTTIRNGFSVAQGPFDLVVISGGNEQEPLSVFNMRKDSWVDTRDLFGIEIPSSSATPSSSSTSSSTASTSTATNSAAAGSSTGNNHNARHNTLRILGATLGSIFGLAILLVLALLFLRWRRRKRWYDEAGRRRRASGAPDDEKDRLSFADRGASFMSQAGGSRGHGHQDSSSSVAIMLGQAGRRDHRSGLASPNQPYYPSSLAPGTAAGATVTVPDPAFSSTMNTTTVVGSDAGTTDRQRSSAGWSRYFLGNPNTTDLGDDTTMTTGTGGLGRQQSRGGGGGGAAATGAPINFSRARPSQRLNRRVDNDENIITPPAAVVSRPGEGERGTYLHPGDVGYVQRLESSSSHGSSRSRSEQNQHAPGAHEETWSPVGRDEWSSGRATSSVYTDSARGSNLPRDFNPALFPQVPTRDSTMTTFPRGSVSGSGGVVPTRQSVGGTSEIVRDSNGVVVPGGMSEYDTRRHSGMSWLILGNSGEENGR
ncbi:MAG: Potassium channel, partial [Watsoniomyces obsoletus]